MRLESFINYFLLFLASVFLFLMREAIVDLDRRITALEDRLTSTEMRLNHEWPDLRNKNDAERFNKF